MTSTQLSIDPADQDKYEKAVEAAEKVFQDTADGVTKLQKRLEASGKSSKSLTRLTESVEILGKYKQKQESIYI